MTPTIVAIVGNPRPASRTHALARTLAAELARVLGSQPGVEVDLAQLGPSVLDPVDDRVNAAVGDVFPAPMSAALCSLSSPPSGRAWGRPDGEGIPSP